MIEIKQEVKVFVVKAMCSCGHDMLRTGFSYPTNPPKYEYECRECGKTEMLDRVYPKTQHEIVKIIK